MVAYVAGVCVAGVWLCGVALSGGFYSTIYSAPNYPTRSR